MDQVFAVLAALARKPSLSRPKGVAGEGCGLPRVRSGRAALVTGFILTASFLPLTSSSEALSSLGTALASSPIGACCLDDGFCEWLPKEDCDRLEGSYLGDFTMCDPNPCEQPPGACCLDNGGCAFLSDAECEESGGSHLGVGTICDPDPCPTPTTSLTWGRLKDLYRTELAGR